MMNKFYAWLAANDGVTGVEYGLICATIGITTLSGVAVMGDDLSELFSKLSVLDGITSTEVE
jgi:Flp pilus assembly pilin Flp